ncbi:hypothetical protein ACFIOY_18825 [Bradyrhizobium sp. TZ2]
MADGRGTEEIAGQLTAFSSKMQVDGYAAYKALARNHSGAIPLAFGLVRPCSMQIRRGVQDDSVAVRA